MRINEVINEVDLSKRAIKYYEEEGLLSIAKDDNGYRNYSKEDIKILKEISVYRKLGISIKDIKELLIDKNCKLLEEIYKEKSKKLEASKGELEALKSYIEDHDVDAIYESLDYKSVAQAIQDMFPGFYGYFFMNHFIPYLKIDINTEEQQEAYKNIIEFWDNVNIKIPLFMKINGFILYKINKPNLEEMVNVMEKKLTSLLNTSEEEYEKLKEETRKNVKLKNSLLFKYHPAFIAQRKFMKRLQDCGYNDIFIPNMISLSPKYKEYHEALSNINERINKDLGLYYDSKFNLVMKK